MAGFRLWEGVSIDKLLDHLTQAAWEEITRQYPASSPELRSRMERALKGVLHRCMYASPACGTSSLCSPSEEGRARPWSRQAEAWGLVAHADPEKSAGCSSIRLTSCPGQTQRSVPAMCLSTLPSC